jgi:multiple sugar transport system substrate-binding protein
MQRYRGIGFATAALAAGVLAAGSIPAVAQSPAANSGADWASTISGPVVLSGWQSSPAEGNALTQALLSFQAKYPNIKVDYQPLAGDYPTVMAAKFASGDVPDLFYVNADYAQEWIDQGLLASLNDYVTTSGFDTSTFFPGYANVFKQGDTWFGFPKDGNTIGMAYNTDLVKTPPATMADLVTAATALKGTAGLAAPMCLNASLDRGLAFIYANGGELLTADGTASAIETDASKAAVQAYLDLFKDGLGMTASDLGAGWCGEALGKGSAAIAFEGGWLDPYMQTTFPDIKYTWAPMPVGTSGSPVTISFTASYSIGTDSPNKDQAFALLSYLTGPEGMTKWTEGGVALPSRSDVPTPAGKEVLTAESAFARPGSGFMPGWPAVQKAFQDAFTAEVQNKTFSADAVVAATKSAIDTALAK